MYTIVADTEMEISVQDMLGRLPEINTCGREEKEAGSGMEEVGRC